MNNLKESAQRVQEKLLELGHTNKVIELSDSTRTAQEAADAIGCEVAQIAKSIIFRLKSSNKPLLIIASGINRINEKQIAKQLNEKLGKADADFVREYTGFVIGGVPPVGHKENVITLIDEDLFQYNTIWAAAGHPKAVFQLTPDELVKMTKGKVVSVK
ncbi:YbaK/EbsC family protein [Aneurinibacillus migulanus]|jgi:prolyl-tRNA editing enzyme YbaK/EbsC (Cys-tRNA(Pro) deacylase)|uniref:Cys-tRNA(Pro) deacylase, prolyl-tRNA editing enzyme YbaK/EbsC n=1 Tax=Aneurinibacillus migulanus TaxID=47500 RepID=A0A0D1Y0U1_ANEMI|nr:YbaK/EbsC family protein [Aneurinibacillus migulanus]KIV60081.1 membrane protein [Aneurinibacillus migulanus]KON96802.1 membrane protein [Aneurinibacillus migulanus]MED0893571.1 YbaK/EbsC family protein [Aneurinibacillus migulanus]MED1616327.1 YbaK/EbsC family protein [Aneurinibacillus migulanus]SDJ45106.1 Cys-tRNA(Pro) deacylase, prolyl-tRNA editing enzyme YbaK/EbsC [Aneurinibacillus migulanus]